jgi:hypothetical protein
MFKRKKGSGDRVESLVGEVTRSAAITDEESEAAITSPIFFARLRARIETESNRRQVVESRPIVPALAVGNMKLALSGLMVVAAVAFWLTRIPGMSAWAKEARPPDPPAGLTACSLSATNACAISTGDVLQLLLSNNAQELQR